jgi:ribosome-binding protein aMBF1 (putative translation factor)
MEQRHQLNNHCMNIAKEQARKLLDTIPDKPASQRLQAKLKKRLAKAIRYNDAQEKAGTSITFEFTGNSPQESIAHRIKQLMKQRGLNQRDLAQRLKVTPAVISRILRHPTRSKLETLSRIARALDVPVRQLV